MLASNTCWTSASWTLGLKVCDPISHPINSLKLYPSLPKQKNLKKLRWPRMVFYYLNKVLLILWEVHTVYFVHSYPYLLFSFPLSPLSHPSSPNFEITFLLSSLSNVAVVCIVLGLETKLRNYGEVSFNGTISLLRVNNWASSKQHQNHSQHRSKRHMQTYIITMSVMCNNIITR